MAVSISKTKGLFFLIIILFCAAGLIFFPSEATSAAKEGITLCAGVIIPSLFPFFVLSSLLIRLGWGEKFGRFAAPVMKPLFGLSGSCTPALLLGLIGGYPVGAKTAAAIFESGECSKEEAEHILSFCNNSGPAFIFGVIGAGLFHSVAIGIFIYAIHILSVIFTGILLRPKDMPSSKNMPPKKADCREPFYDAFIGSVQSSFTSILNVCAFVIFFSVIIRLLEVYGVIPFIANCFPSFLAAFDVENAWIRSLIYGTFELSSGIWCLNEITHQVRAVSVLSSFMLAFGGFSIHAQSLSFISSAGLSAKKYLPGKILQALLAALLAYFLFPLIPGDTPSWNFSPKPASAPAALGVFSRLSAIIAIIFLTFLIFLYLFRGKKMEKTKKKLYNLFITFRR